jgi:hypothetical protein
MLLTKDNLERALMARLMEPPDPYPQWPIAYLCVSPLSKMPTAGLVSMLSTLRLDIRNAERRWPLCRLGAFSRASERNRALPRTDASKPLQGLLAYCKELAVSYTGLLLTMDMFPQVGVLMHHQQQANNGYVPRV